MMFLPMLILVAAYPIVASSAVRHGQDRLWLSAAAALLLIAGGSVLLGRFYAVRSLAVLLFFAMVVMAPIVVVPTVLLSFAAAAGWRMEKSLPMAILGACLGAVCGVVMMVYGLSAS